MEDYDLIETPENVEIEQRLAGLGSRFIAALADERRQAPPQPLLLCADRHVLSPVLGRHGPGLPHHAARIRRSRSITSEASWM